MIRIKRPSTSELETILWDRRREGFSYDAVGATRSESPPAGFDVDRSRYFLGVGEECYSRAREAITAWKMFSMPWCALISNGEPPSEGLAVCTLFKHFGFWSFHLARVVYVLDEDGESKRFGFAYGTLLSHGESGEERFTVELSGADQGVWYEIYAFSKPQHPLVRFAYPVVRTLQARFRSDSTSAIYSAVNVDSPKPPPD